jgi:hypothetical protein
MEDYSNALHTERLAIWPVDVQFNIDNVSCARLR